MRSFFVDPKEIFEITAVLTGSEAHHLRTVLRLKSGDEVTLFDGTGMTYRARIDLISKEKVSCTVLSSRFSKDSGPALHLGQALLTGKKMDLVCRKTTELGISAIYPFIAHRCTPSSNNAKRVTRWQRLALEACKQSKRPTPPVITPIMDINSLLDEGTRHDIRLLFFEDGEKTQNLNDFFHDLKEKTPAQSLFFMIGPEGGFTTEEVNKAKQKGFIPVSLGRQILRAETASLAATAILQYLVGNLSQPQRGDKP